MLLIDQVSISDICDAEESSTNADGAGTKNDEYVLFQSRLTCSYSFSQLQLIVANQYTVFPQS